MENKRVTQEFIAPTVEEAIAEGARQFGTTIDQLDVEILDQGRQGLFGLGSRQARVKISLRSEGIQQPETKNQVQSSKPVENSVENNEKEPVLKLAEDVVSELLQKMHITAKVEASFVPPIDERDQRMVLVEILGRDLSILIGRRSETLNSLQYISSLIVAKEQGEWVPLMIDVQGYRERRERQLRVLARRMAEQVVHTGRKQNLEPMPANERRVIHLELRDHEFVTTESIGEEPNRKVTIVLKKQK